MANVLVDPKKAERAQKIAEVLKRAPRDEEEQNLKNTFSKLVADDKVADADVVEYVYTKLGGLVRTETEQKVAVEKEKVAKAKYSKRAKKDEDED